MLLLFMGPQCGLSPPPAWRWYSRATPTSFALSLVLREVGGGAVGGVEVLDGEPFEAEDLADVA
jgi:hypothetical protein